VVKAAAYEGAALKCATVEEGADLGNKEMNVKDVDHRRCCPWSGILHGRWNDRGSMRLR